MPTRFLGGEVWIPGSAHSTLENGDPISSEIASRWFQALYDTPLLFSGILDETGRVLDANHVSVEGCGLVRAEVIGRPFWEGGWWSPDPDLADQIRRWCEQVVTSGDSLRTASRYFVGDGAMRMVDLSLHPVSDGPDRDGERNSYIVATGLDITDALRARAEREERLAVEATQLKEVADQRDQELVTAHEAERLVRERLARLAGAATDMVGAETIEDLTKIVFDRAFPVLGAQGGALVVRQEDELRVYLSGQLNSEARAKYQTAPFDSPLPGRYVARTGERLILPTRAHGIAFLPEMAEVYEVTGRLAWAYVPLKLGDHLLGSLAVSWADEREISADEVELIEAFAAQCAQGIERLQVAELNRERALQIEHMVESMQRSLLTQSPIPADLDVATRYLPAAQAVQVGGDWYDAFTTRAGTTLLVVGDVAGHDGDAAASMAQLRNLLRGLAMNSSDGPASLLAQMDQAIARLNLNAVATALVAQVEVGNSGLRVKWASAGHPPPVLRYPDGETTVLPGAGDLLLGVMEGVDRTEWEAELPTGSVMTMYTDGLIERRGENLNTGLERLARSLSEVETDRTEDACDQVIKVMLPDTPQDDVVVLMLASR
jgi:PAS domain S-box-containing protein